MVQCSYCTASLIREQFATQVNLDEMPEPLQEIKLLLDGSQVYILESSQEIEVQHDRCIDDELNDTEKTIWESTSDWLDTKIADLYVEHVLNPVDPS